MIETQQLPATTWHQPAVIGWFACALACAVRGGTWVAPARKAQLVRSKLAYNVSSVWCRCGLREFIMSHTGLRSLPV